MQLVKLVFFTIQLVLTFVVYTNSGIVYNSLKPRLRMFCMYMPTRTWNFISSANLMRTGDKLVMETNLYT